MKKILLLFFMLLSLSAGATTLTGGIKYSVDDARIELQNNKPHSTALLTNNNFLDINHKQNMDYLLRGITKLNDRTMGLFSDGSYAINYNNDQKHVWYYDKDGNLIHIEIKNSLSYPYHTYKYTADGELATMTLRVSEGETFVFDPYGQLLGHWVGSNCYDENGNIVMTRKIVK